MRAQRIKTGFHRVAVVLGALPILLGTVEAARGSLSLPGAGVCLIAAIAFYVMARAVGGFIFGLVSVRDRNSN